MIVRRNCLFLVAISVIVLAACDFEGNQPRAVDSPESNLIMVSQIQDGQSYVISGLCKILDYSRPSEWCATGKFELRNDTGEEVDVELLGLSCGCAKATFSHSKLAAGQSSEIEVSFNVAYVSRTQREGCTLKVSGKTVKFGVLCRFVPAIVGVKRDGISKEIDLGDPIAGTNLEFRVVSSSLHPEKPTPLSIGSSELYSGNVEVERSTKEGLVTRVTSKILIRMNEDADLLADQSGNLSTEVMLSDGSHSFPINVRLKRPQLMSVLPNPIFVNTAIADPAKLEISSLHGGEFSIVAVESDDAKLEIRNLVELRRPSKTHTCLLVAKGEENEKCHLKLKTDLPGQPVIELEVFIFATQAR